VLRRLHAIACGMLLAGSTDASAYCFKAACGGSVGVRCVPAVAADCGTPVTWPGGILQYAVEAEGPEAVPWAARRELMQHAFGVWARVDCGDGRSPDLHIKMTDDASARGTVAFSDFSGEPGTLATTTLRLREGARPRISSGKIVFDAAQLHPYLHTPELAGVAVHEAGHLLGLAHSNDPAAIMSGEVDDGTGLHRELTADDVAAVCAAYPPRPDDREGRSAFLLSMLSAITAVAAVACGAAAYRSRRDTSGRRVA
jgi:hypothetical protein